MYTTKESMFYTPRVFGNAGVYELKITRKGILDQFGLPKIQYVEVASYKEGMLKMFGFPGIRGEEVVLMEDGVHLAAVGF